ncbi:chromate transporter [Parasporobacterium paucivorans]|uniref:Chromate transporter n=1 Tax=Parasporobacterium paucivorans DSM 15970 TaxID=1122934 RepID=A0A1M6D518_9FIRM|nr:chromate transporter [Parasporobacterium paucivorans]SHI68193.1 chromate transporter [Parasporobacterium paucivorans DSM 15970]
MIYIKLLIVFFQIGLFSIGGGYAMIPLIQEMVVKNSGWITMREFADLVAISQMTPGPIGINAATFAGLKAAGLLGGIVATIGCVLPSLIIVLILARLYRRYGNVRIIQGAFKGIRPVVVALIATAGLAIINIAVWHGETISMKTLDVGALAITVAAFAAMRFRRINIIWIMLGAGALGVLEYVFTIV